MNLGQTTGARARILVENVFSYVSGEINKLWTREKLSSYTGADIAPVLNDMDAAAAALQTSQIIHEYNDMFCLQRDVLYGGRSRRWLYARGLSSKTDQAYNAWVVYVRENLGTNIDAISNAGIAELETMDFKKTMAINKTA
jgi:hypothetical protein